jgi:low affinity Fe/Cu permease
VKKSLAGSNGNMNIVIYPISMAIENILAQIDSEIARLKQARELLATIESGSTTSVRKAGKTTAKGKRRKKRVLSADARKRIADAQRKRWAAVRAKAKSK